MRSSERHPDRCRRPPRPGGPAGHERCGPGPAIPRSGSSTTAAASLLDRRGRRPVAPTEADGAAELAHERFDLQPGPSRPLRVVVVVGLVDLCLQLGQPPAVGPARGGVEGGAEVALDDGRTAAPGQVEGFDVVRRGGQDAGELLEADRVGDVGRSLRPVRGARSDRPRRRDAAGGPPAVDPAAVAARRVELAVVVVGASPPPAEGRSIPHDSASASAVARSRSAAAWSPTATSASARCQRHRASIGTIPSRVCARPRRAAGGAHGLRGRAGGAAVRASGRAGSRGRSPSPTRPIPRSVRVSRGGGRPTRPRRGGRRPCWRGAPTSSWARGSRTGPRPREESSGARRRGLPSHHPRPSPRARCAHRRTAVRRASRSPWSASSAP